MHTPIRLLLVNGIRFYFNPYYIQLKHKSAFAIGGLWGSWKDKESDPAVKMIRARLELMGWTLEQFEGMIPDVEVKAEGGGTAGVGVANGAAAAGVAVQPTDGVKLALKLIAFIPQRISKSIEMNILQANVICS